ncbi:uncharacterized protein LOC135177810 [Pogoniulus pusillus]|uniref:uncharacterized protein LOC135177810 n=1 Tax=Pogoniulus pusillus TaxID=488313 RepID=UPI0030B94AE7
MRAGGPPRVKLQKGAGTVPAGGEAVVSETHPDSRHIVHDLQLQARGRGLCMVGGLGEPWQQLCAAQQQGPGTIHTLRALCRSCGEERDLLGLGWIFFGGGAQGRDSKLWDLNSGQEEEGEEETRALSNQVKQRPHREAVVCSPPRRPGTERDGLIPPAAAQGWAGKCQGDALSVEGHSVQDLRECGGAVGNRRAGSSGIAEVGARCGQGSPRGLGMRRGTTRPGGAGGAGATGGSTRCSSSFSIRNPARHGGSIDRVSS